MRTKKKVIKDSNTKLVNTKTGEFEDLAMGDVVQQNVDDHVIHGYNGNRPYTKIYTDKVGKLIHTVTKSELQTLIAFTEFTCFKDGILRENADYYANPLNMKQLHNLTGIDYDVIKDNVKSLQAKGVLFHGHIGKKNDPNYPNKMVIVLNPKIFMRGSYILEAIDGLFAATDW